MKRLLLWVPLLFQTLAVSANEPISSEPYVLPKKEIKVACPDLKTISIRSHELGWVSAPQELPVISTLEQGVKNERDIHEITCSYAIEKPEGFKFELKKTIPANWDCHLDKPPLFLCRVPDTQAVSKAKRGKYR